MKERIKTPLQKIASSHSSSQMESSPAVAMSWGAIGVIVSIAEIATSKTKSGILGLAVSGSLIALNWKNFKEDRVRKKEIRSLENLYRMEVK